MSHKQDSISLSSVEAEYVATCDVGKEAVWIRKLMSYLFGGPLDPIVVSFDNQSNIKISKDPMFHARTKYINNKYHYIKCFI